MPLGKEVGLGQGHSTYRASIMSRGRSGGNKQCTKRIRNGKSVRWHQCIS